MPVCLNVCLVPAASNVLLDKHRTYVKLADLGLAEAIQVRKLAHTGGRGIRDCN